MIAAAVLSLAIGVGSLPVPAPIAVAAVPDEPDAFMLPERPTYQAVVADLDGAGSRDLVRLVLGDRGAILAEVWRHGPDGWARVGDDLEVLPELTPGSQANVIFAGTPARLIVRAVEGRERVTVVRQPRFEEPGTDPPCCMTLHDIDVAEDGSLRLRAIGSATDAVDSLLALDLDGDGTDELLAMRSLPPLGRTSFPSEALLYRWRGGAFGAPTLTELPIGSGDVPFVLGDSDGRPGVEAGIITAAARSVLYRIVLDDDDVLRAESSGVVAAAARGVPVGEARGVAVIGPLTGLAVHPWQPNEPLAPAVGQRRWGRGELIQVVELRSGPVLLARHENPAALHVLSLPSLAPAPGIALTQSPAAATIEASPVRSFTGPLPGGGFDARPAAISAGHIVPTDPGPARTPQGEVAQTVAFGGVVPIGLAGPDRGWIALLHGMAVAPPLDPAGGRLDAPSLRTASGVSLAPVELARQREADFGDLQPAVTGAFALDERGTLAVGAAGFVATVEAPSGSRVYVTDADPSVVAAVRLVPDTGRLELPMPPPPAASTPNPRYRGSLTVVTPAGASYVASWSALAFTEPPELSVRGETSIGSTAVRISGRTAPHASVTVDGGSVQVDAAGSFTASVRLPPWPTEVSVVATDPIGNVARTTVEGIGIFDYRALPWIPIAIALVAGAAAVLYLRVPRPAPVARRPDDDAALEEIDPD